MSLTTPSVTVNRSAGTSSRVDAIFSNSMRAAAVAWRRCWPAAWIVLLPAVRPWSTRLRGVAHLHVDADERHVELVGRDLRQRCLDHRVPRSTFPVETITMPSSVTATHESSCLGSR